ncbi:MAG TPA: ABC transporter substrate-binding protein [Clostridiales bacterium]|nr:ABC transporter substrate-binding protein [Clostridiales bacterium]
MKKSKITIIILILLVPLLFFLITKLVDSKKPEVTEAPQATATATVQATEIPQAQEVVNVFNWEDYIDPAALKLFTEETGIKVNYMNFTTNEDMMVQVRTSEGAFDIVFPSDYCVERLLAEDLLLPIAPEKVPYVSGLMDWLKNPSYDANNAHSIPYMWGTVGVLYDTTRVQGDVNSWSVVFSEDNKGEVFMLDSVRDSMGVALKYLGYGMNTRDPMELKAATDLLIAQKEAGIVKAYQVDETKDKMVAGEGVVAVMWSGDAQYAINLNENLAYSIPEEGSNVWVDAMVIPRSAQNVDNALTFINFMCRPDIAQMNVEYISYSTPIQEVVDTLGEEYQNNVAQNPSQEDIDRCEFFHDIHDFLEVYNTLWAQVKNAKAQ